MIFDEAHLLNVLKEDDEIQKLVFIYGHDFLKTLVNFGVMCYNAHMSCQSPSALREFLAKHGSQENLVDPECLAILDETLKFYVLINNTMRSR